MMRDEIGSGTWFTSSTLVFMDGGSRPLRLLEARLRKRAGGTTSVPTTLAQSSAISHFFFHILAMVNFSGEEDLSIAHATDPCDRSSGLSRSDHFPVSGTLKSEPQSEGLKPHPRVC